MLKQVESVGNIYDKRWQVSDHIMEMLCHHCYVDLCVCVCVCMRVRVYICDGVF